jgi:hypothetical protein
MRSFKAWDMPLSISGFAEPGSEKISTRAWILCLIGGKLVGQPQHRLCVALGGDPRRRQNAILEIIVSKKPIV